MVCNRLGIKLLKANSPNAKGKVERPFRYLQDRLCRRLAREMVKDINHANQILQEEIEYHNSGKKHSTTGQLPVDRMNLSIQEGTSVIRSFDAKKLNPKDIFCLYDIRSVDKFHRISYDGRKIQLPRVRMGQKVEIKLRIDDKWKYLRIFADGKYIKNIMLPLKKDRKQRERP